MLHGNPLRPHAVTAVENVHIYTPELPPASADAKRSIREPCLVTCPRITLVSDS